MIQLIAVHMGGSLPVVLEFETDGLNFVQRSALDKLPRSPKGVPELRALGKADGSVQFKFKVAPDKVSAASLPELLAQWEEKFTEATLKQLAKKVKAERDAATAAGLWKDGMDKGDLNAMHKGCSPEESASFKEALAQGRKQPGSKSAQAGKRAPKPKLLNAVIDATSTVDALTGERVQKQGAAESAVTTLRAQAVVASVRAQVGGEGVAGDRQEFADPLEVAREQAPAITPVQEAATVTAVASEMGKLQSGAAKPAAGSVDDTVTVSGARQSTDTGTTTDIESARVQKTVKAHREGKLKGARLVEMSVQDLFKHLDKGTPGVFTAEEIGAAAGQKSPGDGFNLFSPSHADHGEDGPGVSVQEHEMAWPDDGGDEGVVLQKVGQGGEGEFDPFVGFEDLNHPGSPRSAELQPLDAVQAVGGRADSVTPCTSTTLPNGSEPASHVDGGIAAAAQQGAGPEVDWSGLVSFRLDNHRDEAHAVLLETGERFAALAYIKVEEPLEVTVDWLQDAVQLADMVPAGGTGLATATDWLRGELGWRSKELVRWLGKTDLVTPPDAGPDGGEPGEKARRIINAKKRPPNWVATGCEFAALAQNISLDIAMVDMVARDVERALAGMPVWAVSAMQNMLDFKAAEAALPPPATHSEPGAVFRDIWREELQRIDRWCAAFANIKIARQIGLFGSDADQKLLVRLEQLVEHTRSWRGAPAQASRVLAVWLAFVLSLDHENRPPSSLLGTGGLVDQPAMVPAGVDAAPRARRGRPAHATRTVGGTEKEACHV